MDCFGIKGIVDIGDVFGSKYILKFLQCLKILGWVFIIEFGRNVRCLIREVLYDSIII